MFSVFSYCCSTSSTYINYSVLCSVFVYLLVMTMTLPPRPRSECLCGAGGEGRGGWRSDFHPPGPPPCQSHYS